MGTIVNQFYGNQLGIGALKDEQSVLTGLAKLITYEDSQTAQIIEKVTQGKATREDIIGQNLLAATRIIAPGFEGPSRDGNYESRKAREDKRGISFGRSIK